MATTNSLKTKVQRALYAPESDPKPQQNAVNNQPGLTVAFGDTEGSLVYHGSQISTVEELIASAKIDLDIWEIVEGWVKNWEVAGKRKNSVGKASNDSLWKTGLRSISVKIRRKAPKSIQLAIQGLVSKIPVSPKVGPRVRRKADKPYLCEFSLYDAHFGKVCWSKQTDSQDYDLDIATKDYAGAVEDLIERLAPYAVHRVKFPVGNDFLHFDNASKTTTKGTIIESVDDRFTKVFRAGFGSLCYAIERISEEIAPVDVEYVPGNHDKQTSWYLTECLRQRYLGKDFVRINNEEIRPYQLFGRNLIGWQHGDGMSLEKMAAIMPVDAPREYWAASSYRFIRTGHRHTRKQIRYIGSQECHGVQVDVIPSLSATDAWHYENGYVGNLRAAEVFLWHRETGPAGQFPVEARSALAARS